MRWKPSGKVCGQSMKEKATDELVRLQAHDLLGAVLTVILPAESDVIVVESFEAAVGDGDAMGVAAEIGEDLGRPAERPLGVDNPIDAPHGGEVSRESGGRGKRRQTAEEAQSAGEGSRQSFHEQASEHPRERFDGEKEVLSALIQRVPSCDRPPPGTTQWTWGWCVSACPPCVQEGDAADRPAEPVRIGGERRHRLRRCFEQDRVDDSLVLEGDCGDWSRQCEDDVEIGNRQKLGLARREPLGSRPTLTLRAMPVAAGIIGDPRDAAVFAGLNVSAERLGPACNDRAHHAPLDATQMTGMITAIGVALLAQDIGDLDDGPVRRDPGAGHDPAFRARPQPGGATSSDRRSNGLWVARIV